MVIIAVLIGATTFAQGLYINAGAGYGFPAAPYQMAENYSSNSNTTGNTSDYEIVKGSGSFGKGLQAGAIIGYMFNPNVGAELGISYLFGGKIESKDDPIVNIFEYKRIYFIRKNAQIYTCPQNDCRKWEC